MTSTMQPSVRSARLAWVACAAAALLSACNLPPVQQRGGNEPSAPVNVRRGDHAGTAAQDERQAAGRPAAEQVDLLLAAVREWLLAGRTADASRVLALIGPQRTPAQSQEFALLDAETALDANRTQEAWQKISAVPETAANGQALRVASLRARIALSVSRPVDAVRAEIGAERYATSAGERTQLRSQLLSELRDARNHGVKLEPQASTDATIRGWLDLGAIATDERGASLTGPIQEARWRAAYPGHPALEILAQAFPPALVTTPAGARIALLLPLTGPAAAQASTVRDGFLSAYYQLPQATRPDLRLYDTGAIAPTDAIAQAHAAGASFVVGPLTREDVAAVADLGSQSVPVLALNYLPNERAAPANLFQFAISPENEARLAARRILADGHHQGIALVPRGDWGNRVLDAFNRELSAGGGKLITATAYDPSEHDYGYELKSVLRISDSEAREQRLASVLGTKLNFEPRHRSDIDFIFIAPLSATNARLIAPQLKYFYAGDIPSYSVSNAYEPDSTDANRDIDGLIYPDMPWMISDDSSVDAVRATIGQAWGDKVAWRTRLFAFGYDACQLMLALSSHRGNPADVQVAGLTGQLHFDDQRRVQRDLIWVQVNRDGEPRRVNGAPASDPN